MLRKEMDSLDVVEAVIFIEEIFGTDIPERDAEGLGTPKEIADWLEPHLSNRRPNKAAVSLLKKLANDHDDPRLADGLGGTWRREQIEAVIGEIFRQ